MGTQMMGSQSGAAQESKVHSLTREGSLYGLTLDEIQIQLGDIGKPLGSMNLDELLKSVCTAEANLGREMAMDNVCVPTSSLHQQGSMTLSRNLTKKTVDEVWKNIQQKTSNNSQEKRTQGRQATLGEMTLEDFLARAGVVTESTTSGQMNAGPILEVDLLAVSQQNVAQHPQWMQYQLPSLQPQPQPQPQHQYQQNLMAAFMPTQPTQQSLPVGANPIIDAACPESQITMSPSSLVGTQTPGRKRVGPGDMAEKTVERRQKRMIKNRESAARSRARKQAYTHELENKVSQLEEENERLRKQREVEVLPSAPPPEPKYQLRRTSSSPF